MVFFLFFLGRDRRGGKQFFARVLWQRFGDFLLDHRFADHGFSLGFREPFTEPFNTAGGVEKLLLTRKERVAAGADIDFD